MKRKDWRLLAAALVALLSWLGIQAYREPPPIPFSSPPREGQPLERRGPFRVARVLDGDTIKLEGGETVRLIGVDAPETKHPELPVQRFGEESGEFLRQMLEGFEVILEVEPGERTDKYGRTLAYVWKGEILANAEMVRRGYAYAYTRFGFRRQVAFLELEGKAREAQYGLWHLSLRDGRLANLADRYASLNLEGRKRLDQELERLVREYPASREEVPPPPPAPPSGVLSWREAESRVGERVVLEGTVLASHGTAKACFLNFHKDYRKHLSLVIFASALSRFPAKPEAYYKGRKVRVTGEVRIHEGRPEIVLEDPGQVEVLP